MYLASQQLHLKSYRNSTQFQDALASAAVNINKLEIKCMFSPSFMESGRGVINVTGRIVLLSFSAEQDTVFLFSLIGNPWG